MRGSALFIFSMLLAGVSYGGDTGLDPNFQDDPLRKGRINVQISFPNPTDLQDLWPQIQEMVEERGGSVQFVDSRSRLRNLANQARKAETMQQDAIDDEDSWKRVSEIMSFNQTRLERFLSGFGDEGFRSSVINSVLRDIDVLLEELTVDFLSTLPVMRTVVGLLGECGVRSDENELMRYMLGK